MKIKNNNILKQIGNDYVIIPLDDTTSDLDKVFKINKVGVEIYNLLEEDITFNALIDKLLELYSVDKDVLISDVDKFINKLKDKGLIDV